MTGTRKMRNKNFIKIILIVHRYLGFVLSLFFLVWFLSGFVMMYKDFPYLSRTEQLERLPALPAQSVRISPVEAAAIANQNDSLASFRVGALLDRPVYRFQNNNGNIVTVFADDGSLHQHITPAQAEMIVKKFINNSLSVKKIETSAVLDQWTPRTRFLPYMPLHKVYLDDDAGTVCYVSAKTGEIIQKLDRSDKLWAWLGAIPHWIYFKDLRIHTQLWRDVVVAISLVGVLMSIAGIVLGIQRYLKAKRKRNSISPYKKVWFRWHHILGFVFGVFVFTWILSGLFSMNPWHWSPETVLTKTEQLRWQGMPLSVDPVIVDVKSSIEKLSAYGTVKELELTFVDGKPYWIAYYPQKKTRLLAADDMLAKPLDVLPSHVLVSLVSTLKPEYAIAEQSMLDDYDAYYYDKHRTRSLPVIRVKFSDNVNTWYYIDPMKASVVKKNQQGSRLNRWIYNGLHSLDFPVFFYRRPLWDVVVIVLLLGGTALSFTGVALTLKWIRRKRKKKDLKNGSLSETVRPQLNKKKLLYERSKNSD